MKKYSILLLLAMGLIFTTSCGIDMSKLTGNSSTEEEIEEEDEDEEEDDEDEDDTEEETTEDADLEDAEIVDNNKDGSEETAENDSAVQAIYDDILSEAKKEAESFSGDRYVSDKYSTLYSDYVGADRSQYGYLYEDLNGDGVNELMLCVGDEVTSVYTVKDNEAVLVLEAWVRNSHRYLGDGEFYNVGSNGAADSGLLKWKISKDGTSKEYVDGVRFYDGTCYKLEVSDEEGWVNKEEITQEEYDEFMESCELKLLPLDYKSIFDFEGSGSGDSDSSSGTNNLDYSFVSGKTFKVFGSKFALEWRDEFTIKADGTFSGVSVYGGETENVYEYSGSFGAIETISPGCYSLEIKQGEGYLYDDSSVTLYDKGFAVADLPEVVKEWSDLSLYKDITSGDTLPCQIIYNIDDGSVYAEKTYMAELRPEDNTDTTEASVIEKTPFYGIWCHGTKDEAEADSFAQSVTANTGIGAQVFVTTDWNNLNTEKFYVVTAGIYATEESANEYLSSVQASYPDAYVKYSGDYIGN